MDTVSGVCVLSHDAGSEDLALIGVLRHLEFLRAELSIELIGPDIKSSRASIENGLCSRMWAR